MDAGPREPRARMSDFGYSYADYFGDEGCSDDDEISFAAAAALWEGCARVEPQCCGGQGCTNSTYCDGPGYYDDQDIHPS